VKSLLDTEQEAEEGMCDMEDNAVSETVKSSCSNSSRKGDEEQVYESRLLCGWHGDTQLAISEAVNNGTGASPLAVQTCARRFSVPMRSSSFCFG